MSGRLIDPDNIGDMAAIAEDVGVSPATVKSWRQRHDDFPEPIATLAIGPVWDLEEVTEWIASHPRTRGRPKQSA